MSLASEHVLADKAGKSDPKDEPRYTPGHRAEIVINSFRTLREELLPAIPDVRLKETIVRKIDNLEQSAIRAVTQHRV